jgi:hypothetical protein
MTEYGTVGPCPSDELLAAFVERGIAAHRRADVERHVAGCPTCLDVVAASLAPVADVDVTRVASGASVWAETPPSRPWRSWAIAASLLLTLGASVFVMRERYLGAPMAPTMARLGARLLGLSLQAGSMDLRLGAELGTFVIALKDVTIGRVGRRYHADEIGMTVALAAPLTGEQSVQYVHVTRPTLDLVGRDPKDIIVSPSERGRALDLLGQANRVDVEDRAPSPRRSGRYAVRRRGHRRRHRAHAGGREARLPRPGRGWRARSRRYGQRRRSRRHADDRRAGVSTLARYRSCVPGCRGPSSSGSTCAMSASTYASTDAWRFAMVTCWVTAPRRCRA